MRKKEIGEKYALTYDFEKRIDDDPINPRVPDAGIYIVRCQKYYKIGYTQRIGPRMTSFAVSNPFPVELVFYLKVPRPKNAEYEIHQKMMKYHHKGEWFLIPKNEVELLINSIKSYGKIKNSKH